MDFYGIALTSLLLLSPIVFFILLFYRAPYGRHRIAGGIEVPAFVGWCIMELPAIFFFLTFYNRGKSIYEKLLAYLFVIHYFHRGFIYPSFLKASSSIPLWICILGSLYCSLNGYLQAAGLSRSNFEEPRFILGIGFWFIGFVGTIECDYVLVRMRERSSEPYRIPRGGAFEFLSAPNYVFEVIQWLGWAIATNNLAGFSFFLWSFCNLVPRALAHHRWYRDTFPDYPPDRKALVPFLF